MKAIAMGWGLAAVVCSTAIVLGGGCGTDVATFPSGSASGSGDSTATGGMTTGSNGTGGAGGAGVGGAPMTTGASMSSGLTTSSGSSMTSGSGMSSSASGGVACPSSPNDTMCAACAKTKCCADYNACVADPSCVCWSLCLAQPGADQTSCGMKCGFPSNTAVSFGTCVNGGCQQECASAGTSSATSSGSSSGASTGTGGNLCNPAPNDTACATCSKQHCCAEIDACLAKPNCTCWVVCSQQNPNNPALCFQTCGGPPDQETKDLAACAQQQCGNECP